MDFVLSFEWMQEAEDFDIHFIDKNLESLLPPPGSRVASRDVALAALAMVLRELPPVEAEVEAVVEGGSIWDGGGGGEGWRTNHALRRSLQLQRSTGDGVRAVQPRALSLAMLFLASTFCFPGFS